MRLTCRCKAMRRMQLMSLCLIILAFTDTLVNADRSTLDRIKKHQEWLRQRYQQKTNTPAPASYKLKSFEMPTLWRFNKPAAAVGPEKSSINDVYPENDSQPQTTAAAATSTTTTTTTTTETPSTPKSTTTTSTTTQKPVITSSTANINNEVFGGSLEATSPALVDSGDKDHTTPASISTESPATSTESSTTTTSTTTTTHKPKPKPRPYPRWSNWSPWSDCSRSCGGGVMYQQRKCINRNASTGKRYVSNDCVGVYRRYRVCNDESCPSEVNDFRAQQCSSFDDVDFQGKTYTWEPYIKVDAECELNCKPLGMKYFATLNATVIDGTPCSKPAEYYRFNYRDRAICVGGICKAVQASGLITGMSANSGAVSCGGLLCRPITGIFTRDPLPEDAYVHVATIPAGASNISITELKNSINLLVLRTSEDHYVFNGDNKASENAAYEAVGAIFDYHRIDGLQHGDGVTEWISCTGPIRDNIELMIYSRSSNPGIKYEYLLPIGSDSEENELSLESDGFLKAGPEDNSISSSRSTRRRKFNWKVVGFSACTKSCGGGTQAPIIRCARENPVRYYSQRRCMHSEKPVLNENLLRCNTQPCPAYWRIDEWGDCKCHTSEGYREREVSCVQELASGIVIHVDDFACMEEQPLKKKVCDCPKTRRRSHLGRYRLTNANGTSKVRTNRDKSGIWLMSDWNQYCSAECGTGVEYRTIFCDRSKPNAERCDPQNTPDITRSCERDTSCGTGDWFSGPWGPCNGNCFNLTRSRQVLCIQNQLITDDEDCNADLKPQTTEKCSHEEVEYCAPRWHYSEWSECSKSCDGGTQRRYVKCLEYDAGENTLREASKCRYALREPIYRSCNTHKCEDLVDSSEPLLSDEPRRYAAAHAAPVEFCVDKFSQCDFVIRAQLCIHDYYAQNCCRSCANANKISNML